MEKGQWLNNQQRIMSLIYRKPFFTDFKSCILGKINIFPNKFLKSKDKKTKFTFIETAKAIYQQRKMDFFFLIYNCVCLKTLKNLRDHLRKQSKSRNPPTNSGTILLSSWKKGICEVSKSQRTNKTEKTKYLEISK